jgi:O-methyltransferase
MQMTPIVPHNDYLELMKKCLLSSIYDENGWYVLGSLDARKTLKEKIKAMIVDLAWTRKLLLVSPRRLTDNSNAHWGLFAYTMIGKPRLDNIQFCIEDVIRNNVPGDLIETGVWRGGATIFMRAVLRAHRVTDRTVWVADSFEGLPSLDKKDAAHEADALVDAAGMNIGGPMALGFAVPLERVQENFRKFDLLDDQVKFLKGWFKDTLPTAPIEQLAILRLDGDMYASTMDALNALYHKVSKGGYVIVDDYNAWPHCKQAITDFRNQHNISSEMVRIDDDAIYWKV